MFNHKNVTTTGFKKRITGQHDSENWFLYRKNILAVNGQYDTENWSLDHKT